MLMSSTWYVYDQARYTLLQVAQPVSQVMAITMPQWTAGYLYCTTQAPFPPALADDPINALDLPVGLFASCLQLGPLFRGRGWFPTAMYGKMGDCL